MFLVSESCPLGICWFPEWPGRAVVSHTAWDPVHLMVLNKDWHFCIQRFIWQVLGAYPTKYRQEFGR